MLCVCVLVAGMDSDLYYKYQFPWLSRAFATRFFEHCILLRFTCLFCMQLQLRVLLGVRTQCEIRATIKRVIFCHIKPMIASAWRAKQGVQGRQCIPIFTPAISRCTYILLLPCINTYTVLYIILYYSCTCPQTNCPRTATRGRDRLDLLLNCHVWRV